MYPVSFSGKGNKKLFLGAIALTMLVNFLIGALTWPWLLNTALGLVGKKAVVLWWQGGLIGMVPGFNYAGLVCCVLVWIATLFFT